MKGFIRIVPSDDGAGPHRTQGTQVFVGDQKVDGVTRIELVAQVGDDLWRAKIECYAQAPEVRAQLDAVRVVPRHEPTGWASILRLFGKRPT